MCFSSSCLAIRNYRRVEAIEAAFYKLLHGASWIIINKKYQAILYSKNCLTYSKPAAASCQDQRHNRRWIACPCRALSAALQWWRRCISISSVTNTVSKQNYSNAFGQKLQPTTGCPRSSFFEKKSKWLGQNLEHFHKALEILLIKTRFSSLISKDQLR